MGLGSYNYRMLSYLLLLSASIAYGINNNLRSDFLEELSPESASDSLTPEGLEDASSQPILAQAQGWTRRYDNKTDKGYYTVEWDDNYADGKYWSDVKKAPDSYAACGFRIKTLSYSDYDLKRNLEYQTGLEVIYCNYEKGRWGDNQKSDTFELVNDKEYNPLVGIWKLDAVMCEEGYFVNGIWGIQDKAGKYPLVDFGFACYSGQYKYVLYPGLGK